MVWARRHVEVLDTRTVPHLRVVKDPLPPGLEVQVLSRDNSDGAVTAVVRVPAGWKFGNDGWALTTRFDAMVISGALSIGKDTFELHDYTYRPAGHECGPVASEPGADVVVMTYGRADFRSPDPAAADDPTAIRRLRLTDVPLREPLTDKIGLGLLSQTLRHDLATGERIFVNTSAPQGFVDERIEWHQCVEEGFSPGRNSYMYRPPGIPHGPFTRPGKFLPPGSDHDPGASGITIMRVNKKLFNNYVSLDEANRMWREVPDLDPAVVVRSYRACGLYDY